MLYVELQCWTPHAAAHNLHSWRWTYRSPKRVELFMIINHNCCIKLVPLVIFIYDARSQIYQYIYILITNLHWLLFIHKILFSLHVSSIKCSSSGGHSCTYAAYGTVTLYKSSWWPVDTQLFNGINFLYLMYVWPCIIYGSDERYQLDETIMIYYHK